MKNSRNSPPTFQVSSAAKHFRILARNTEMQLLMTDLIRMTHNSFARSDPFQSDETRATTEDDDVYHFISFAVINDTLLEPVMSTGRVGSQFWDVSDSIDRSCWRFVTRPISDRSGYSEIVTRPIFRLVGLRPQPDPTGLRSGLNIIKSDSTDLNSI